MDFLLRCLTPWEWPRTNVLTNLIRKPFRYFWFVLTLCDENRHDSVYIMQIVIVGCARAFDLLSVNCSLKEYNKVSMTAAERVCLGSLLL